MRGSWLPKVFSLLSAIIAVVGVVYPAYAPICLIVAKVFDMAQGFVTRQDNKSSEDVGAKPTITTTSLFAAERGQ